MSADLAELAEANGWQVLRTDEMTAAFRGPAAIVWHSQGQARGIMRLAGHRHAKRMSKPAITEELQRLVEDHLPVTVEVLIAVLGGRVVEMATPEFTLLEQSDLQLSGHLKADHDVNPMLGDMLSERERQQLHDAMHTVDTMAYGRYARPHAHVALS